MEEFTVFGTATVTVSITVEAETEAEARAIAEQADSLQWSCDDVDGDVTILDE